MRGPSRRTASWAAVLLGAAALSACGVGRSYRPASAHAVEDGGVRAEATGVGVGQRRNEPPAVGVVARITAAAPVRLEGIRLAAGAAEPCGTGHEPSVSYRLDASGRHEQPLAGDLAPGTIRAGALFPIPPASFAPAGPAGLDVTLTGEGAPRCLRVPLAAAAEGDWRELRGVVFGYATRGQWGVDDGESKVR